MRQPTIYLVGLGPGDWRQLTLGAMETMRSIRPLYLRTAVHPTVEYLREQGIEYESFDSLYETGESFEAVYSAMVDKLLGEAKRFGQVCFAVPGHPLVAEAAAMILIKNAHELGVHVSLCSGVSCLDALFDSLGIDPSKGILVQDALNYRKVGGELPQLILQVYDQRIAGDLKLALADEYGDEATAVVVRAAGVPGEERVETHPVYELDRLSWIDHLSSIFVPTQPKNIKPSQYPLDPLTDVMQKLRAPDGCPWDRKQTHDSLRPYVLEEAYEVVEAINQQDAHKVAEELGDLLLQIVFHSQIAQEVGEFDINDVVRGITEKLIRRHPHIFSDWHAETPEEVTANWEKIKVAERQQAGEASTSLLDKVGQGMPALMRSYKLQAKAATVGFDWENVQGAWDKVDEELRELLQAAQAGSPEMVLDELGDLLFAVVNVARFLKTDPEVALTSTCDKFQRRFRYIERAAATQGLVLDQMTLVQMDHLWNEAKLSKL